MKSSILTISAIAIYLLSISCSGGQKQPVSSQDQKGISKNLALVEWEARMNEHPGILLDVRTKDEFDKGSIPNAVNIDWYSDSFNDEVKKLDMNKPVYVYCHSGSRSQRAMNRMIGLGFSEVYNLKGGIMAWKEAHP